MDALLARVQDVWAAGCWGNSVVDAVHRLGLRHAACETFAEPVSVSQKKLCRSGDLLLGFVNASTSPVTVELLGYSLSLQPFERKPALLGTTFLPVVALRYSEINMEVQPEARLADVLAVWTHLSFDLRKAFAGMDTFWRAQDALISLGTFARQPPSFAYNSRQLPHLLASAFPCRLPEDLVKELMARAWHPDRMAAWCLEREEAMLAGVQAVRVMTPSRFWFDEALVVEAGAALPEFENLLTAEECAEFVRFFKSKELASIDNGIAKYDRGITVDANVAQMLYDRTLGLIPPHFGVVSANDYIRFSQYHPGGKFELHRDGINQDRRGNRSVITVNIFLNEDFEGGSTDFYFDDKALRCSVLPRIGRAAIFDSQQYHRGSPVVSGTKYLLRTDLMAAS